MLHQGAIIDMDIVKKYLQNYSDLVKHFLPDITIGTKDVSDYKSIYNLTMHELSHASHFAQVGTSYWNQYILYVLEAFVLEGGSIYGNGSGDSSGYCEVGEMWAYYMQSKLCYERYGGTYPNFGTEYWFSPQVLRYLEERGLSAADIFCSLQLEVNSRDALKDKLVTLYPGKQTIIEQIFERYKYDR